MISIYIFDLAIDGGGNKWIGTNEGLAVYKEYGIVGFIEQTKKLTLTGYFLQQNYPNPFNPFTTIKFTLPKSEPVNIEVYSTLGQRIETLIDKRMPAGYHQVEFNAQNLSSGIYFYKIETGQFHDVKKMILIK